MNYAIEQRLVLIDFLLAHYGFVRRDALMDHYGISRPQVSHDFNLYRLRAPENMTYNHTAKRWERSETFKRLYG